MSTVQCRKCGGILTIDPAVEQVEYPTLKTVWCETCVTYVLYRENDAVTLFSMVELDEQVNKAEQSGFALLLRFDAPTPRGWIIHDNGVEVSVYGPMEDCNEMYNMLIERYHAALVEYFVQEAVNV